VGDYRPISLIHSFAKLFTKLITNRLRSRMSEIVSANQFAFIQGRNLHDHFILVRQLARKIKSRKEPCVLLKLDLTRAFDSLSWAFLFEVLRQFGFPELYCTGSLYLFERQAPKLSSMECLEKALGMHTDSDRVIHSHHFSSSCQWKSLPC
jgi:hypothetical protein